VQLVPASAGLLVDPADKLGGANVADRAGTVRAGVGQAMGSAQSEVFVVSPYFVPGEIGMRVTEQNSRRGVRLRLLTNSLAATDEPAVHAGYMAYRKEMVAIGAEVYELSPTLAREQARLGRFGESTGALHAKVIVIDQSRLFVGSMNLDGRSERYNTELGVLIDSPAMAHEFLSMMDFESSTYRLRLGPDGELQWVRGSGANQVVLDREPEVGVMRQMLSRLLGGLLPQDWL
jgi:putative cardiolipin synthase